MSTKNLVNQPRAGRWLILLLALLTTPLGLRAQESYDITVAGVEVTSDNASSITGANITAGTVSFDASTNTLTLNNVTMSGNVVSSLAALNVKLVGVSTFNIDNSDGNRHYLFYSNFYSNNSSATLTFSADELGATLQGYGTTNNYKLDLEYWFDVTYDNIDYWSATTTQMDNKDYCQVSKPYVIVDGSAINDANKNNPDISGVSFDLTNNKVTLSGFQRENQTYNPYSLITSNIANLNVDIQGGLNYIYLNTTKTKEEITSRGFVYTGASGQVSSLNVTVAEGSKLLLSWSGETATTNWLQEGFAQTNMALDKTKMQEAGVLAEAGVPYGYQMTISNYTPPVSYGITVAGVEVTSNNASDILSEDQSNAGIVSYDAQTNTLALNGAYISGYTSTNGCITTNRSALNIAISGNNTLDCSSSDTCTTIRSTLQGGTALTFVKGGDHCSLTLKGGYAIHDFASVTVAEGLYWDEAYTYENGITHFGSGMSLRNPDGSEASNAFLSDGQPLGLTIAGIKVTTSNADNILGDSHQSVSYDAANHLLTLKGANITDGITCNETISELTFHLVGYNAIYGDFIVASPQATTLHFTTSTKLPGSLHLGSSNNSNLLDSTIDYQNGLFYEDGEIQAESEDVVIASFTGYVGYINEETNSDYIYSGNKEFYASKAVCNANNNSVIVSTKESETSASMWPTSINTSLLKTILVQYDWGTNTNKNVTVQIRGLNQDEFDGNTYSEAISLSSKADADGIVEIPLNKLVTSENVQIYFSSDNAFSFMPLSIAFADYPSYGISVCNTKVNELNAADVLGDGKVSYDVEKKTLTLNKATLDMSNEYAASPVESRIQNLTVKLIGETQVTIADRSDNPYVFRYIGEEQTATLTLETQADESGAFGSLVASGVEELGYFCPDYTLNTELHPATDQTNGWEYSIDPGNELSSTPPSLTVSYTEYYDLWFNDERFTSSKRDAGFSGTMSYDDSKKTLTLGGEFAYSSAVVRSQMPALKIELAGTNTISDVIFQATNDVTSGTLTIAVKEGTPELKLYTTDDAQPFAGFSNVSYENKLHLTHVEGDQQNYYLVDVKVPQEPDYHFSDDSQGTSYYPNGSTVYNLKFGQENTLPWLIGVPNGLAITYRSSDEATATIDQKGHITLTGAGHVWIYASNEETDDYVAHTDSIRLEIRPMDPQTSIAQGAYYTGQKLELISTVPNGEMYYRYSTDEEKVKYTEPLTLAKGKWEIYFYTKCGSGNDEMWSYGNNHPTFYVYDELTFTPESGTTSNDNITVEIGNLPSSTPNATSVFYFFGEDDEDDTNDLLYNTTNKVNVAESTKVTAYIKVEGDSNKVYKTEPVEAEYVIRTVPEMSFVSNNKPVEVAEWTIGGTENQPLPTVKNELQLQVTYSSTQTDVATVDNNGSVTPVGVGETYIKATSTQTDIYQSTETSYLLHVYKMLNHESITIDAIDDQPYTGAPIEPTVTVKDGQTDITNYVDIAYSNNVAVGSSALVTITPKETEVVNYYKGSATTSFNIVNRTLVEGKDVTFASGQSWASYFTNSETLEVPEGIVAYVLTGVNGGTLTVQAISKVPQNVPVLLEKTNNAVTTNDTYDDVNLLQGTAEATSVTEIEGVVYVLYNGEFVRTKSGTIPAHRAYLVLSSDAGARLSIGFDDEATGIRNLEADGNGNDVWFSLDGQRFDKKPAKKGLYIHNGEKEFVK